MFSPWLFLRYSLQNSNMSSESQGKKKNLFFCCCFLLFPGFFFFFGNVSFCTVLFPGFRNNHIFLWLVSVCVVIIMHIIMHGYYYGRYHKAVWKSCPYSWACLDCLTKLVPLKLRNTTALTSHFFRQYLLNKQQNKKKYDNYLLLFSK